MKGEQKKIWKTGLLSAFLPTVTSFLLLAAIGVVYKQLAITGPRKDMERKAENYAELAAYAPKNATVFFGDSITELCNIEDIYAQYSEQTGVPVCNRGISGECTASILARIEESVISIQPRNLVMLMGVNDLNQGVSQEQITENIRQMIVLLKEKSPQTHLVLQAVYPTDTDRKSFYEQFALQGRDNKAIRSLNEKLAAMAKAENIVFLDVTPQLADTKGFLKKEYTFDGLHPNSKGYLAIRSYIIEQLV